MVIVSLASRVVGPLPNGLNGLEMGVTNHLLTGMILQAGRLNYRHFQGSRKNSQKSAFEKHAEFQGSNFRKLRNKKTPPIFEGRLEIYRRPKKQRNCRWQIFSK